jgi:hypothetical protein
MGWAHALVIHHRWAEWVWEITLKHIENQWSTFSPNLPVTR